MLLWGERKRHFSIGSILKSQQFKQNLHALVDLQGKWLYFLNVLDFSCFEENIDQHVMGQK